METKELQQKAENGDETAMFNLGVIYYHGMGVSRNWDEALKWLTKAAEFGEADAKSILSAMYTLGHGVKKDPVRGMMWAILAAERNGESDVSTLHLLEGRLSPSEREQAYRMAKKWIDEPLENFQ